MTEDELDLMLQRLGRTIVLEPDAQRRERLRARCRVALAERSSRDDSGAAPRRFTTTIDSGLAYALSLGYAIGMIVESARVFLRR